MMYSLNTKYPGQVELFVQDGLGQEIDARSGYRITDTGPKLKRLARMSLGGYRMFRAVLHAHPKIAHFHDPELIPWAILLRLFRIKVIYDVHEDYPEAIAQNFRLPLIARKTLPIFVRFIEWMTAPFFNGIVTTTPTIAAKFPSKRTVLIRNWPIISEFFTPANTPMQARPKEIAYIGTITKNRNIIGMLDAICGTKNTDISLRLAGDFPVKEDEEAARLHPGWEYVHFHGWVSRENITSICSSVRAGLVVIKPIKHLTVSLPIKLFEYMAAGLPVIVSDFPLWRAIVEESKCGLLVDPMKPNEITNAIDWIINHPDEAQKMGERGRKAVATRCNWQQESLTLFGLYERIMAHSKST
jgi:glycosyltransferase involved in cell wall biosynthesis